MAKKRRIKQARGGSSARNSRTHPTTHIHAPPPPVAKPRKLTVWCAIGAAALVLTAHFTWLVKAATSPKTSPESRFATSIVALAQEVQAHSTLVAVAKEAEGVQPKPKTQQIGAATLHEYDDKGRVVRTGQDIDRNGKLEGGGIDRVFRVEYSFERGEAEDVFWDVQRQWTCPRLNDPREILANEFRKRTGFGWGRHEKYGRMIGQTVQTIVPNLNHPEKTTRSTTTEYKSDDYYFTTVIQKGMLERVEVRLASLLRTVTERDLARPDSAPHAVTYEFDGLGRQTAVVDSRTGRTETHYNLADQLIATIDADGNKTTYTHYGPQEPNAGKLKTKTGPAGLTQRFAYNPRGQLTAKWGTAEHPVVYFYNAYGERTGMLTFNGEADAAANAMLDAGKTPEQILAALGDRGQMTKWVYDEATGVLLRKQYADGKGTDYAYTPDGRLKTQKNARGDKIVHEYEEKTAEMAKTVRLSTDAKPGDKAEVTELTRDRLGNIATVEDKSGKRAYQRDDLGRMAVEELPGGWRIERDYDAMGNLARVGLKNETGAEVHFVGYTWNADGSLAAAECPSGTFAYRYVDGAPNLLASITGPVAESTWSYEPKRSNLITKVENRFRRSGEEISTFAYTNDELGRRVAVAMSGPMVENPGWIWKYNSRSELISAIPRNPRFAACGLDYDGMGNRTVSTERTAATLASFGYKTNALNQYTEISDGSGNQPSRTFVYDLDGNLLADDRAKYHWDSLNRLVGVETRDGIVASYAYDHRWRRIRKYIRHADGSETQIRFIYDDSNLLAEIPVKPGPYLQAPRFYTWGRDLTGTIQGAAGVGGLLAISEPKERETDSTTRAEYYPSYDANGNVVNLVDEFGKIRAHYEYGPFGNELVARGDSAVWNPMGFSTKYSDLETGQLYFGERFLQPWVGRWPSFDPIGEEGGLNLYAFVRNQPIGSIDYLGRYTLADAEKSLKTNYRVFPAIPRFRGFPARYSRQQIFDEWYRLEKEYIADKGEWWTSLPKCPLSIADICTGEVPMRKQTFQNYGFEQEWFYPAKPSNAEENLHPGTKWSMRSFADANDHSNQCTYDEYGELFVTATASGTVDWHKAKPKNWTHFHHDVAPVFTANALDGGGEMSLTSSTLFNGPKILETPGANISKYLEVRPLWSE